MKKLLLPLLLTLLLNFGVGALVQEQPVSAGASDIGETTVVATDNTGDNRTTRSTDPEDEASTIKIADPIIGQTTDTANDQGYTANFQRTITKDVDITYTIDVNITVNINRQGATDDQTGNPGDATPQPIGQIGTMPNARNTDDRMRNTNDTTNNINNNTNNNNNRRNARDRRNTRGNRDIGTTDNNPNNSNNNPNNTDNTNNEEDVRNYSITGDNTGRVKMDPDGNNPRPMPKCPACA